MSGDEEEDDASNVDSVVVVDVSKEAAAATWASFSTPKQTNSGKKSGYMALCLQFLIPKEGFLI